MIRNRRLTAILEGEFVVFLTGLRVNQPWSLPVHHAAENTRQTVKHDFYSINKCQIGC